MDSVRVTITGVDRETGLLMVRDPSDKEFEIDAGLRPKGLGLPEVDERWVLQRNGRAWRLDYQIGAPPTRTITGVREGQHPVMSQVLDALGEQGVVRVATTGQASTTPEWDDTTDPADPVDPDLVEDDEDIEPEDPETIPEEDGPKGRGDKGRGGDGRGGDDRGGDGGGRDALVRNGFADLYLCTYNIQRGVGPARLRGALHRLVRTEVDIIGMQEMPGRPQRRPVIASINGWNNFYPESGGEAIMWRASRFEKIGEDMHPIHSRGPGMATRWVQTVILRDKVSHRVIPVMNTHISAWIETNGRPRGHSSSGSWSGRIGMANEHIEYIQNRLRAQSHNGRIPFVMGDMNIDWFADHRVRYGTFPARKWGAVGASSSWVLGKERTATFGRNRYLDHVWAVGRKNGLLRWDQNWVLTGYPSDHKPLLTKARIRVRG